MILYDKKEDKKIEKNDVVIRFWYNLKNLDPCANFIIISHKKQYNQGFYFHVWLFNYGSKTNC